PHRAKYLAPRTHIGLRSPDQRLDLTLELIHARIAVRPSITEETLVVLADDTIQLRPSQEARAVWNQQTDRELNGRHAVDEPQTRQHEKKILIGVERRPGGKGDEGWNER